MRSICFVFTVISVLAPQRALADAPDVDVRVDRRVELFSIIFRLAGNPEYNKGRVDSYIADVEEHFGAHRGHAAIEMAQRLRRERGIAYDAVMSMAIHLDATTLETVVPLRPRPAELDERWPVTEALLFLGKVRRFAQESEFDAFFKAHQPLYDTAVIRLEDVLRKDAGFDWFDTFFGARPGARFTLALGMLNGGACYGPRVSVSKEREDLYCVLGVWSTDGEGLPQFDRAMLPTVAHEFCHSYVNWLVYKNEKGLEKAGETIFPHVAAEMRRQAYGNWKTMMCESLVRAAVVRYVRATQGAEAAQNEADAQVQRSFLWTPQLAVRLEEYEASREQYKTFEAFMPKIVQFFSDYAPEFDAEMKKKAAAEPKVVAMTPANGDQRVDPALAEIKVTFSRRMQPGFAFVGGGPNFPETNGRASYDATGTIVTLPVKLKPNWDYEFWLNRGRFDTFRSVEGVQLKSVHVRFRTGPAK